MQFIKMLILAIMTLPYLAISKDHIEYGFAQVESEIILPFKDIENLINSAIPQKLAVIKENNRTCVEAQWLKTKVPKFKGLKIYTKTLKTKISPEIKCDVDGWVHRAGRINVSANGQSIRVAIPIDAKISAKALVSETAKASAIIFVDVSLSLDENWQPIARVNPSFIWSKKPTLKLFGVVKVTIAGHVNPQLQKQLDKLAQDVTKELSKYNFQKTVSELWEKLNKPLLIHKKPLTSLHFLPTEVSYTGFTVADNTLKSHIKITGKTAAYIGVNTPDHQKTALVKLKQHSISNDQTYIKLPITVGFSIIEQLFSQTYPDGIRLTSEDENSVLEIFNLRVKSTDEGKIHLMTKNRIYSNDSWLSYIDVFNWGSTPFNTHLIAKPVIDHENQLLRLDDVEVRFDTNNTLVNKLIELSFDKKTLQYLTPLLQYNLSNDLQKMGDKIHKSMNAQYGPVMISGVFNTPQIEGFIVKNTGLVTQWSISGSSSIKLNIPLTELYGNE